MNTLWVIYYDKTDIFGIKTSHCAFVASDSHERACDIVISQDGKNCTIDCFGFRIVPNSFEKAW